jgi:alpha-galactosidase
MTGPESVTTARSVKKKGKPVTNLCHDEAAGTWLLQMRSTSYAFALTDDGAALDHLYWGTAISPDAVPDLVQAARSEPSGRQRARNFGGGRLAEYVPWGGMGYDEPSLKVHFADGNRSIDWRFAGHRISSENGASTLEVDFADIVYSLRATLFYRMYDGFDVLERWAVIRNAEEGEPFVVRLAHAANWWLPDRDSWRLRYLHGGWASETQLAEAALIDGKLVLESRRGTTSHQLNPWFTLDAGDASEETGEVWSGELAWSGSWKIVYETTPAGHVHVSGGWNDFDWSQRVASGESLELPVFAGLFTDGGFGAASREWHAWQREHVLARGSAPLRPVLYNSWEATSFDVSVEGQARLAELAADVGAELFVVDDGWFAGRINDRAGLGDWSPDPAKFPSGLDPLIKRVNALGMRFGLWVEPEMTNPDSDLYRAHPDWVYHFANRTPVFHRNQLVLNLARPDVASWVYSTLDALLSENNIEFFKWDMNRPFADAGWPSGDDPQRIWVDHVRNLYSILDRLRAAHPGVEIESCCGGGGRVDIGIMRRVEQFWTSDNTDAWDRVAIQEGFTQGYTPQAMMAWVTDSPNEYTGRKLPLSFRFHVAMAGSLGIGGNLTSWDPAELAEARQLVAGYKEIREVVQRGRLYRLASARRDALGASQYVREGEVVILAWWGPDQCGPGQPRLRLAGLEPTARYRDLQTGTLHDGAALMRAGLALPVGPDFDFGSALVRLVRVG